MRDEFLKNRPFRTDCIATDRAQFTPSQDAELIARESWLTIAQRGFDKWAAKPHNARWIRRISGTPIPNDIVVCIGEEFSDRIEALSKENERLRKQVDACDWYWPEDDTSSDAYRDSPNGILEDCDPHQTGAVVAVARGGVVDVRYHASLPPAEDADSDDDFEVDEATRAEAELKIAAEKVRRAALEQNNAGEISP